jgi:glycosyltransferase involved in cell wall biosynthesis
MKRVLIGITNHNFEKYINECIQSALSQTYLCDIFVTDDASSDRSREEIMKYQSMVNIMFHLSNSGDELRGMEDLIWFSKDYDYLYFLSGDDAIYPNAIGALVDHAEKNNSDWTYGGLDAVTEDSTRIDHWTYDGFPESIKQAVTYMWVRTGLGTTLSSLFSTRFLKGKKMSRFPNVSFSLDASTAIDWYTFNPKICRLKEQVLKYRWQLKSGRSIKLSNEREQMEKDMRKKLLTVFGEEYLKECLISYGGDTCNTLNELNRLAHPGESPIIIMVPNPGRVLE